MKTTREDALNLIRHWKDEGSPLRCTSTSEGSGFRLTGTVAELSDSPTFPSYTHTESFVRGLQCLRWVRRGGW